MARRRLVDPAVWKSGHFKRLNLRQRLLWLGLITHTDDTGKLKGEPEVIKSEIFPFDRFAVQVINADLDVIQGEGLIERYEVDGDRYIWLVKWSVYQKPSHGYRSNFGTTLGNTVLGFELGADISTAEDLDDYYVFDRNPEQVTTAFSDIIFKHLDNQLPKNHLHSQHQVSNGTDLASRMFTERSTFEELSRASEGVIRDLINIFTRAFFNARRRNRENIDRKAVLDAAQLWFEQDKSQHLDDQLQTVLRRIVDEVIGKRRARSFLLPKHLERHPVIQRLFDARVLHHMQRGYADKDNPGIRYNIYTLDYGTYVDLMGTSRQPAINLFENGTESDIIVPFDDKRSIRRIILTEEILS